MDDRGYERAQRRRLYKDPDKAKICGVCAGIAEYLQFEVWVVRIIAVSLLLFFNGGILIAYFVLCLVLDPKPGASSTRGCFGAEKKRAKQASQQESKPYQASVRDVWRTNSSPKDLMEDVESKFAHMEKKLQALESYVTSNRFNLDSEFKRMAD